MNDPRWLYNVVDVYGEVNTTHPFRRIVGGVFALIYYGAKSVKCRQGSKKATSIIKRCNWSGVGVGWPDGIRIKTTRNKKSKSYYKTSRRKRLLKWQNGLCLLCNLPLLEEEATLEHIRPKFIKTDDRLVNLAVSHESCNVRRGIEPLTDDQQYRAKIVQFKSLLWIIGHNKNKIGY
jgi:hypothetical protein